MSRDNNRHLFEKPAPCQNCDSGKGATMGSSDWGHSVMCCSDECGNAVAKN